MVYRSDVMLSVATHTKLTQPFYTKHYLYSRSPSNLANQFYQRDQITLLPHLSAFLLFSFLYSLTQK